MRSANAQLRAGLNAAPTGSPPLGLQRPLGPSQPVYLGISIPSSRMRAPTRPMRPMRSMTPTPPRTPRTSPPLFLFQLVSPHKPSQPARNEKENAIHNPKHPTRLQHPASLINTNTKSLHILLAENPKRLRIGLARNIRAVIAADAAQVPDACDECPDKTEVDEGDESAVIAGTVVGEYREDGPDGCEDGGDKEDKDGGGGEEVLLVVDIYEVGEHAEGWDLGEVSTSCRGGAGERLERGRRIGRGLQA